MRISDDGIALIQAWEGLGDGNRSTVLLEPYICPAKVYTLGWGHALTTPTGQVIDVDVFGPAKAAQLAVQSMDRLFGKQAISKDEATALLHKDVQRYETAVTTATGDNAAQCEFDAMVAFCFNIGIGGFQSSAVLRLHNAGSRKIGDVSLKALCQSSKAKAAPVSEAIAFVRWSNSNGAWTLGLFRRRLSELLVYGGHDFHTAVTTAQAFHD